MKEVALVLILMVAAGCASHSASRAIDRYAATNRLLERYYEGTLTEAHVAISRSIEIARNAKTEGLSGVDWDALLVDDHLRLWSLESQRGDRLAAGKAIKEALEYFGAAYGRMPDERDADVMSVLMERIGKLEQQRLPAWKKGPNQALQPTPTAGTSAAEQPLVPAAVVADL